MSQDIVANDYDFNADFDPFERQGKPMELTRFDLKNQAIMERIAKALEELAETNKRIVAALEISAAAAERLAVQGLRSDPG
jgi:hypothetical protein